jgi:hypothetical protein
MRSARLHPANQRGPAVAARTASVALQLSRHVPAVSFAAAVAALVYARQPTGCPPARCAEISGERCLARSTRRQSRLGGPVAPTLTGRPSGVSRSPWCTVGPAPDRGGWPPIRHPCPAPVDGLDALRGVIMTRDWISVASTSSVAARQHDSKPVGTGASVPFRPDSAGWLSDHHVPAKRRIDALRSSQLRRVRAAA